MEKRLKDIIEVPEIKTVIELDDADIDPQGIVSNFILTEDVEDSLRIILQKINDSKGCGIFVKGGFGSGKSHFLSYLYLLLKNKNVKFVEDYPFIKQKDIKVAKVSLVKYPSSHSLESIILSCLGYKGNVSDREELLNKIAATDTVIIIDELSEFLRSKPSPSAFYEDTRFLQFLGEFSFRHPLWIIASLQEWIEETGHISANTFNRIKDRYPIKVNLTSSHIEDIIDKRIVLKKEGAYEIIKDVFSELRKYYPNLPLNFEDFKKTYPLHPFTVRFLSGLTPVFSQNRGIIQFVFTCAKNILNETADILITPETIFDHFEERIREIPEYSRLARVVYDYYKTHIEEIFSNDPQKDIALDVIKILVLTEISPLEKKKTAKDIAEILLKKISTIKSDINYQYLREGILEPLVSHQMYILREGEQYYIDPKLDEGIKVKSKIKSIREKFADRVYLFREISSLINLPYLPLKDIFQNKKYRFIWQNSIRECVLVSPYNSSLSKDEILRMLEGLSKRLDGFLVIFSPFTEEREKIYSIKEAFPSPFLPLLMFWMPGKLTEEDILFIEEYIAKHHLLSEFPELQNDIKKDELVFKELISNVYFSGEIICGSGRIEKNLKQIGYLPIEKLLGYLFDHSLTEIHPNHFRIMPRVDYYSSHHLNSLFNDFIKQGKITIDSAEKKGLNFYINGLLEPLGIVKKRSGSFLISLDAENDLVSHILNIISHEDDINKIFLSLKKGAWGMSSAQINLILSALITSGSVTPYGGDDEPVEIKSLQQLQTGEITKLKQSKSLSANLLGYIHYGRFIWGDIEDIPTPLTQKTMWKSSVELIRKIKKLLEETNSLTNRYSEYSVFKKINIDAFSLNRLQLFVNSLTLSLQPIEGIERILLCLRENSSLDKDFNYLERVHKFLTQDFQEINKYYMYLTYPSIQLPNEIEETRKNVLTLIEESLRTGDCDILKIKDEWDNFFRAYTDLYKESHEQYYSSPTFRIKKEVEESEQGRILKRITMLVSSVVFEYDWWRIKNELSNLPNPCVYDLPYELYLQPICKCGYRIGSEPPIIQTDFDEKCRKGIINFISQIQKPEYREKIESYILGIGELRDKDTMNKILSLLRLNIEEINISLALSLLTDNALQEIENALKGRWKIKEINIDDLVKELRGRRLKFNELKNILLKWIGDEEESIIWIKSKESEDFLLLDENLAKYGIHGEILLQRIKGEYTIDNIEEQIKQDSIDSIKWQDIPLEDLLRFIDSEKLNSLKKRLREEIYYRLKNKTIKEDAFPQISDETTRDLLTCIRLLNSSNQYKGIEHFIKIIAPLNLLLEKLRYENEIKEGISYEILNNIQIDFDNIIKNYDESNNKYNGVKDLEFVKENLNGIIVIFDGLRYDLWNMFKDLLIKSGFVVNDVPFIISTPSTTINFRKVLGIEDRGIINGKSYTLLKWAEKGIGKKELRNNLKERADIKFLHFNFIDVKAHSSSINLYPLFLAILTEFKESILPVLKGFPSFILISDHGFNDTGKLKERYSHGGSSIWEVILPFAEVKRRII